MKLCTDCVYCLSEDYLYREYNLQGTMTDCLLILNPYFPLDGPTEGHLVLTHAELCDRFRRGGEDG